ncbi:MAG: SpoIID/LytB domain-containing protein [Owenweeksia sp.]
MKIILGLVCMLTTLVSYSIELKVRLYSDMNVDKVIVTPDTGLYYLVALNEDMQLIDTVYDIFDRDSIRTLYFNRDGKNVSISRSNEKVGEFNALRLISAASCKEFRIEANGRGRIYQDDLQIRVYEGHLQVVNVVDIEKYVAGVVESEGGHVAELEYFKAQAVLARTFALKNLNKHLSHGYNLKDDVTSQVYFSKCHYKNSDIIKEAVDCTADTVVVTEDCNPILGVFHANSGGQTVGSEHAWLTSLYYLQPKQDSFSVGVGSYKWEKKISKNEFYAFYARSLKVANDVGLHKAILNFEQPSRKAYFEYKGKRLKLTRVRRQYNLRSTYFTLRESGGYVILQGRGYGHGVGLSQDGAIEMSRRGYSYQEILQFYFNGIELEAATHIIDPQPESLIVLD